MNLYINRLILSAVLLMLSFSAIHAQLKINTYSYFVDETIISDAQRIQLEATVLRTMNEYYKAASFMDDEMMMVTSTSVRKFEELFQPKARLLNDLTTGVRSHYSDYSANILNFLQKGGVKFDMQYGIILDMEFDKEGFYTVRLQAEKIVYTGLDYTNKLVYCKEGRRYDLEFYLQIEKTNLDIAKFSKITGTITRRCAAPKPFIGFGIRAASDILQNSTYQSSSFLENEMAGLNYSPNRSNSIGAGFNFQMPITKNGLYANIGLDYTIFNLSGNMEGNYIKQNDILVGAMANGDLFGNTEVIVNKMVDIQGGQETINAHTLQIPVGFRYRKTFLELEKLSIIADVLFIPTLHLISTSDLSVDKVVYNGIMDTNPIDNIEEDIVFFPLSDTDLNVFGFGEVNEINTTLPELQKELSFSLRIAPGIQYEVAENLFFELTLDYTLGLTSFLNNENLAVGEEGDYFLEDIQDNLTNLKRELNRSFMETYLEETKINTIGLKLGLAYLLN